MGRAAQSRMHQQIMSWLGDAHAMETQAIQILENQARRIESYPDLQRRFLEHLEETRGQIEKLEGCMERYGSMPSSLKDAAAMLFGNLQALGGALMVDEVVKGSIVSYTFEHLEIACYRSLIGAAEELGDPETARTCTDILHEEEAMAGWLEQRLPELSRKFLRRQRTGRQAKR